MSYITNSPVFRFTSPKIIHIWTYPIPDATSVKNSSLIIRVLLYSSYVPYFNYSFHLIGAELFPDNSLISVKIPNGVTAINDLNFSGCFSLETCIIPNSVNDMGKMVFVNCQSLKNIVLSENVTNLLGNGVEGTDSIGAFYNCSSLESITLPKNINFIDNGCFHHCLSLSSIRCEATIAPQLEYYYYPNVFFTFYDIPSTGTLYYPEGSDYSGWIAALPEGWTTQTF